MLLGFILSAAATTLAAQPAVGWRGDGTGKYPSANPPTTWARVSTALEGLGFQTRKPDAADRGTAMPDGVVREWLILGPVVMSEDVPFERDLVPDEARLAPEEGQKTGPAAWKKVALDTAYLDFAKLMDKGEDRVAYAFTHIYSATGGTFRASMTYVGKLQVYVNGKANKQSGPRTVLELNKGWNHLLVKVSAGKKDWYLVPHLHACAPAEYRETNILWRTELPEKATGYYGGGMGVASPLIIGDRMYLPSEPFDLICLNKVDGKVLWLRRSSFFEAADAEDRKSPEYAGAVAIAAKIDAINAEYVAGRASPKQLEDKTRLEKELRNQMKRVAPDRYAPEAIPDIGFSGFTPSTDGRFIYVWFGNGVSACYDLDGKRRWLRVDRRPAVEHGFSSSPLLIDGKLVVFMRDLLAFDGATGQLAWQVPVAAHEGLNPDEFFHGSPVAATIGGTRVIVLGNGSIVRADNGKRLFKPKGALRQTVASPVVEGNRLLLVPTTDYQPISRMLIHDLPEQFSDPLPLAVREVRWDMSVFPKHYLPWYLSSPVVHEGLAYLVNNAGVLTVIDIEAAAVVYHKMLDLDVFQGSNEGAARGIGISPALAGKHLYLFGNSGAALVLEPGRTYRQIARNKIESVVQVRHWSERQERFVSNPVFEGNRLYLRGESYLYAIGQR
jgi:outer membrane protein assembly factor BamB